MDAASSEWKGSKKGRVQAALKVQQGLLRSEELVEHWKQLVEKYPIYSIEDGLDEGGLGRLAVYDQELGGKVQLVGG